LGPGTSGTCSCVWIDVGTKEKGIGGSDCARKVETTPVPDLNIYDDDDDAEKGRKESTSRWRWS